MGLGLYMLGGALSGAGEGMNKAQTVKDQERRDAALSALRQQEMEKHGEINDQNDASSQARRFKSQMGLQDDDQSFRAATGAAASRAQAAEGAVSRAHEERMLRIRQGFDASQNAQNRALEREKEWGKPLDSFIDEETGDVTLVYRDGKTEKYGGVAKKRPTASQAGSSLFADEGGAAKPTKPVAPQYRWDPNTNTMIAVEAG